MTDGQITNRTISSILISSICVMNADGSGQKRLTEFVVNDRDSVQDRDPAWSPDGTMIGFWSSRRIMGNWSTDIYVIHPDGSGLRRVTDDDLGGGDPTWSPDGKRIAFSAKGDIYVINADGTELQQITRDGLSNYEPAWSPDGKRIAFTSRENETTAIYLIDLDRSQRTLLYANPQYEDSPVGSPAWSPDGRTIAFTSEVRPDTGNGNAEIYIVNTDLTGFARLTHRSRDDTDPAWSPHGNKIVFASNQVGNSEIYVINPDVPTVTLTATPTPHVIPLPVETMPNYRTRAPVATFVPDEDATAGKLIRLTQTQDTEGNPTWSPRGDKIAFECLRDGQFANSDEAINPDIHSSWVPGDICLMNSDGSGRGRLTDEQGDDSDPAWSPDGNMIAFSSRRGGQRDIYVMNADGSELRRVTDDEPDDTGPSWSPDGKEIAFSSTRFGNTDIYVIGVRGSGFRRITFGGSWQIEPAWSPDGRLIAVTTGGDDWSAIDVITPEGYDWTRLPGLPGLSRKERSPAWSPDGLSLAYTTETQSGFSEIYNFNAEQIYEATADDSALTRMTNRPVDDSEPSWSPNGSSIVFAANEAGNWEIYVMVVHDPQYQRLSDTSHDDSGPVWSPDGTQVAYVSGQDNDREIYVVDADGSGTRQITNNDNADFGPAWSPDGTKIAYIARHNEEHREIFVVNADGSNAVKLTSDDEQAFPHFDGAPSWSPDGKRLTFPSQIGGRYQHHILNFDGTQRESYSIGQCPVRNSSWAPDGSLILYTCGDRYIYLLNLSDGKTTSFYCSNQVLDSPTWAPDGVTFAFECEYSWGISQVNPADGSETSYRVCRGQALAPSWSHDGEDIAVICKDGPFEDIYTIDLNDRSVTRITYERSNPRQPSWSPVSNRIAFASNIDGDYDIYIIDVEP